MGLKQFLSFRGRFEAQDQGVVLKASGQGAMLMVAVVILLALIIGGTSISMLGFMNSARTVATKTSMQTYYVAMAGVQEATASRLMPRTNYPAFNPVVAPFFATSGRVYQNPVTSTGLLGIYRYVVVGGDPARQSVGGAYYNSTTDVDPTAPSSGDSSLLADIFPPGSSFFVVSNGMTCLSKTAGGKTMINGGTTYVVDPGTAANAAFPAMDPSCTNGSVPDELTVVAEVTANGNDGSGASDNTLKIKSIRVFRDPVNQPDDQNIKLSGGAFVPGYGWVDAGNTFGFDTAYSYGSGAVATKHPAALQKVVFYDYTNSTPTGIWVAANNPVTIAGPGTTTGPKIPMNTVIRLYFNGPVDYRSIAGDPSTCTANPSSCNIKIVPMGAWPGCAGPAGAAVGNLTYLPAVPQFTSYILWPQYGGSLGASQCYQLQIQNMASFNGSKVAGGTYNINFGTN